MGNEQAKRDQADEALKAAARRFVQAQLSGTEGAKVQMGRELEQAARNFVAADVGLMVANRRDGKAVTR